MPLRLFACLTAGLVLSTCASPWTFAQSSCKSMPGMYTNSTAIPPEKLAPPERMTGLGNSTLTITTSSPEAQVWFNQGLNLLHDFWDFEASRAFEQATRLDPKCTMCFWGLYQAEAFRGEDDAWATAALKQAEKLAGHATPAERLYIKAAKESDKDHLAAKRSPKKKKPGMWTVAGTAAPHVDSKETKAYRKLVLVSPEDVQAKIFLAESLVDGFDKDSKPKPGTAEAQTILAALLVSHPDDTAANHYWIHAQEPGLHPELALDSARKLGPLTATSGHMVHMPGHIFYRTGNYETARVSFEDSMHADESYMLAQHVSVDDDWNYVHNLMYLIADLLEAGRLAEATQMSAKLEAARGSRDTTLYRFSSRDGMTRLDVLLPVTLRAGEWARATALLEASKPAPELVNLLGLRTSLMDYTQGMRALTVGDTAKAEGFSKDLDARLAAKGPAALVMPAMPAMPGMGSKDAMAGPLHSYLDVVAQELHASVLLAQGKATEADAAFAKAQKSEHDLGYREPPYSIRPVAETRGDALMRAGRYADAKAAYQTALAERPNSGYPQYGIAEADVALKDSAAATADYMLLLKDWVHADEGLPQIQAARAWIGVHSGGASGE